MTYEANIRRVTLEGVLLPHWEWHGSKFPDHRIGDLIVAFRCRFCYSLLPQFFFDTRERGKVRFVVMPSHSEVPSGMPLTPNTVNEMSYFVAGFLAAADERDDQ